MAFFILILKLVKLNVKVNRSDFIARLHSNFSKLSLTKTLKKIS
jgi:hypothetical protein